MWVVQPGDGSPDDDVPGDGSPDWIGGDQDDATGALDGPGLVGSDGGEGLGQGLWLTASAPLPPGLVSSVAAGGGTGVFGFGQGGVLEALPPGPVLAAFIAEAADCRFCAFPRSVRHAVDSHRSQTARHPVALGGRGALRSDPEWGK
jgi:hypothetical protein